MRAALLPVATSAMAPVVATSAMAPAVAAAAVAVVGAAAMTELETHRAAQRQGPLQNPWRLITLHSAGTTGRIITRRASTAGYPLKAISSSSIPTRTVLALSPPA